MDAETLAPLVYTDAKHFRETEEHLSQEQLIQAARDLAKGVYDFWIGDDINTLLDNEAHWAVRGFALFNLTSTFFGGPIAKVGGKLAGKLVLNSPKFQNALQKMGASYKLSVMGRRPATLERLRNAGLNEAQIKKYTKSIATRSPSKNLGSDIYKLKDDKVLIRNRIASNNNDGSYAVWDQVLDKEGEYLFLAKPTYDKNGKMLHWALKEPSEKVNLITDSGKLIEHSRNLHFGRDIRLSGNIEDYYIDSLQKIINKAK